MMTKKDLFRLIIKIFGLYLVISTIFSALPSQFSWAIMDLIPSGIIYMLLVIAVTLYLFSSLILHPDKIIKWLKLDKGFDNDEIHIDRFNTEGIFQLATIIIGGHLLVKNIPIFLSHLFFAFKSSAQSNFANDLAYQYGGQTDYLNLGISVVNLIIGYLLLTNYRYISKKLIKKDSSIENLSS